MSMPFPPRDEMVMFLRITDISITLASHDNASIRRDGFVDSND